MSAESDFIIWRGLRVPLLRQLGNWRLRKRSKELTVNYWLGPVPLREAKEAARQYLDTMPEAKKAPPASVARLIELYEEAPKRCSLDTESGNIARLKSVLRDALGKEPEKVDISQLADVWPKYVAIRQGVTRPDYSSVRAVNLAINSAMKQAVSLLIPALRPYYKRHGLTVPEDAGNVMWLPQAAKQHAQVDESALIAAWEPLRESDKDLWLVVGLARFAGLRQSEILACRGNWIIAKDAATYVEMRVREDQGYQNKTKRSYRAIIMQPALAEYLRKVDPETQILVRSDAARWIERGPQKWLRQFMPTASAPLHRLRALYADHVKNETEQAVLARQAGISEAAKMLGHTSDETTKRHYLSGDEK